MTDEKCIALYLSIHVSQVAAHLSLEGAKYWYKGKKLYSEEKVQLTESETNYQKKFNAELI